MQIHIEKLVFGGQGLGKIEQKAYFIWNALPAEITEIKILKNAKNFSEGVATKIIRPSPDRIIPQEVHFLSCSPWQIITAEKEKEWKIKIAEETYRKIGGFDPKSLTMIGDGRFYGYRNKIEYSFAVDQQGELSLAFFERATHHRQPISPCCLAQSAINLTANSILQWAKTKKLTPYNLKSVIIRSNQKGEVIAGLFIKDRMTFPDYPALAAPLIGFQLFYSTHKSPASVPTAELYSIGQKYLEEEINGKKIHYGLFSFFQVNPPIFQLVLNDLAPFIDKKTLVDYYCGVGVIGLTLKQNKQRVELVESNPEAITYAEKNIALNNLTDCQTICQPAEKIVELIAADKTIIFDPPRAGLDTKIIQQIIKTKPALIAYLSCNISTQARDIALLSSEYKIEFMRLYNFFPRTDHIESLVILKKLI